MILAINAGSSSVKCALFTADAEAARATIANTGARAVPEILKWIDSQSASLEAIGHRIVHGGPSHAAPQWITPELLDDLRRLVPFAPNHLPDEIAIIEALGAKHASVPQLACFDTAFHQTMPEKARRLPIPAEYDARGIRRYGFHGLSYTYLISELRRIAGDAVADGRVVLAHLGSGSSLAALRNGRSIDTTMAFTPLAGVIMSTRSGDLDPGVVTFLGRNEALSADEIEELLSKRSGLLGISGVSGDMRALLEREASDPACALAIEMFVESVVKAIGAFAATLGGLDTLVFSGGIGEHAAVIRARICQRLDFLGMQVHVIPTNEELVIARAAQQLLAARGVR